MPFTGERSKLAEKIDVSTTGLLSKLVDKRFITYYCFIVVACKEISHLCGKVKENEFCKVVAEVVAKELAEKMDVSTSGLVSKLIDKRFIA